MGSPSVWSLSWRLVMGGPCCSYCVEFRPLLLNSPLVGLYLRTQVHSCPQESSTYSWLSHLGPHLSLAPCPMSILFYILSFHSL